MAKAKTKAKVKPAYTFDSSAFINPYRRYYPFDVFPSLWSELEQRIASGEIVSIRPVLEEISERDDALTTWVKAQKGLFSKVDHAVQAQVQNIVARWPNWVDATSGKNDADPFVVGHAIVEKIKVVSHEVNGGPANLKIPYVCAQLKVDHLSFIDFMREIGLRW
jgi:hypothetical protein